MATFTQAVKWLKQGRKVQQGEYIYQKGHHFICHIDGSDACFTIDELQATDWQLYDDGQQVASDTVSHGKESDALQNNQRETLPADTSLTTELSVSPSLAAKILKLVEKESKRKPRRRKRRKSR